MFFYSKELITVATMLDTRTQKANGSYPVKIRVNRKCVRAYYPTGKSLTKEDWLALPSNKSHAAKALRESIENSFSLVRWNVEMLLEKGLFSFEALDSRSLLEKQYYLKIDKGIKYFNAGLKLGSNWQVSYGILCVSILLL